MVERVENRMVVDSEWPQYEADESLPTCECCGGKIKQFRALHILSGKKRVWICDRCIEDMKENIGFEDF